MQEPTRDEIADYVADMAEQLALMSPPHMLAVAALLRIAAQLADAPQE